jgi:small ligand-binding sensory domain FIST
LDSPFIEYCGDSTVKIATALTRTVNADDTSKVLADRVRSQLGDAAVDLAFIFASAHYEDELQRLALELHERLPARAFVGVTAEGVIHSDQEYESQPALAVWAANLPDVEVRSFHLAEPDLERLQDPEPFRDHLGVPADANANFILLGDPFSFSATPGLLTLLDQLNHVYPGRPVLGGMASAAEEPGQNLLIFDGHTLRHGMVGVGLWGKIDLEMVVSQGCRPIGRHLVVTRADGNVIHELSGKPPLEVVKQLLVNAPARDRQLLQRRGLLVGYAINEYQKDFVQGDFLIRLPIAFDPESGAMAINDLIRTGQTVQFQVRDDNSATSDLDQVLSRERDRPAAGALLFTCSSRGTRLFKHRSHDARMIYDACGELPMAGFFAAGEIGPVGQKSFLNGQTASIGFFRPRAE